MVELQDRGEIIINGYRKTTTTSPTPTNHYQLV
jgi:hypothetical protein